jgi:hypothetical protein
VEALSQCEITGQKSWKYVSMFSNIGILTTIIVFVGCTRLFDFFFFFNILHFWVSHGTHIKRLIGATILEHVIYYETINMFPTFRDRWMSRVGES